MTLAHRFLRNPYQSYVYAYPHKTAYRMLPAPIALDEAWASERRHAGFLYVHIPFCEMRCGFCNLFTRARPQAELITAYLSTLERQATRVRDAIGPIHFARRAMGGGTPTFLDPPALHRIFDVMDHTMGARAGLPTSAETSPETATRERLGVLRERGVDRISIGVQSFLDAEAKHLLRPQRATAVRGALERIRSAGFPTLNIDLMYGIPGQNHASFEASLRAALEYHPEEIYLYPLYVRARTGLERHAGVEPDDTRLALYRHGCAFLAGAGYERISMRMFRARNAPSSNGPVYCCQTDGMVGLGCGARSYTTRLHYSDEYAVGARGVQEILEAYVARTDDSFSETRYGFVLDDREQRRRFVILSLLADGLDARAYAMRFGGDAEHDFPELAELVAHALAERQTDARCLTLTNAGVELSDAIGPWLASPEVRSKMALYVLR
ncbi:STM4012 family radical SAM protein [Pendulispora rubella]|uniref:STM4012 family radical SAM protein n=1 Tax=Pendulispora rubella TaxID=2741070 RepID=A0ABZ2L7Q7_9BACT